MRRRLPSHIRSDEEFAKLLKEIKKERFRKGIDNDLLSDRRLTRAIARVPRLRDILLNARIEDELKRK